MPSTSTSVSSMTLPTTISPSIIMGGRSGDREGFAAGCCATGLSSCAMDVPSGHDCKGQKGTGDETSQHEHQHEQKLDVAAAPLAHVFHALFQSGDHTVHAHNVHIK